MISVKELFSGSFKEYKKNWRVYIGISAIPFLVSLITLFLPSFAFLGFVSLNVFSPVLLLGALVSFLVYIWSAVAMIQAVNDRAEKLDILKIYKKTWSKISSYLLIVILISLATLGGLFLLIVPGIIFAVWFSLSTYVFVVEGGRGVEALKKSKQYVTGNWWPVAGRFLLLGIVYLAVSAIAGRNQILSSALSIFLAPFSTIYIFLLYENLSGNRSRRV